MEKHKKIYIATFSNFDVMGPFDSLNQAITVCNRELGFNRKTKLISEIIKKPNKKVLSNKTVKLLNEIKNKKFLMPSCGPFTASVSEVCNLKYAHIYIGLKLDDKYEIYSAYIHYLGYSINEYLIKENE